MVSLLGPTVLRYIGICFCSPYCVRGSPTGARVAAANGWVGVVHGPAYRLYSDVCTGLAGTITFASFVTLCMDSATFAELADGLINFCSLYTTWVYIRVWMTRAPDLHAMLAAHLGFLDGYRRLCRRDPEQNRLFRNMLRVDKWITLTLLVTILGLVALVVLQSCLSLVPPLPPVPRLLYAPPPAEGEADPLGASRTLRFALILMYQCAALICCGVPFACLGAMHFALNAHAIYLIQCMKRYLELVEDNRRSLFVDVLVKQHQHVVSLIQTNNNIFAVPISVRIMITYALLGLTAYSLSADPLADVKVPIIAAFMVGSLLIMVVLSDSLKDQCGSLQEVLWRCHWLRASPSTHRKLLLVTMRSQRYKRDGLAAAGMQDRLSMVTFVQVVQGLMQVMRSSVSFLQALRNLQ